MGKNTFIKQLIKTKLENDLLEKFLELAQARLTFAQQMIQQDDNDAQKCLTKINLEIQIITGLLQHINVYGPPVSQSKVGRDGHTLSQDTPEKEKNEEGAQQTSQLVYQVRLIKFDETKKKMVILQVQDFIENMNMVQVTQLVESIPQVIGYNLSKDDAETMKVAMEEVGGVCVIE